jgi:DNA-binding XRE family transcriptional regulator
LSKDTLPVIRRARKPLGIPYSVVTCRDLLEFRKSQNRTQARFAIALGISKSHLQRLESESYRDYMPKPVSNRIAVRFHTLREGLARRRPPSTRTIEKGEFCDRIIVQMRRIKRQCIDGGRTIVEIQSDSPNLDVWKLFFAEFYTGLTPKTSF